VTGQITSFDASMSYLQSQAPTLTLNQKRLVLSVLGQKLGDGYSASVTNNANMDSVFQNARNGGHEGGICGDIHTYLSRAAASLGFEAAGTHTAYWWQGNYKDSSGHAVTQYRDPVTGEYYMQNYSHVYATGQKTLPNLIEVSTRILGFSWASNVESLPGTVHQYIPRQARWISEQTNELVSSSIDEPHLRLTLSNREQSASVQYGWANAHNQIKGYALGSRFEADEGRYGIGEAGVSYTFQGSILIDRLWLQEAGIRSDVNGGALWMETPLLRPAQGQPTLATTPWNCVTSFQGAFLSGYLRQGGTTETVEFEGSGITCIPGAKNEFRLAIDHAFKSVPINVYFQRVLNFVNRPGQPNKKLQRIETAYDKLGARLRLQPAKALTFGATADAFALEGTENNGGTAIRIGIEATFQTQNVGSFTLGDDWGKVLRNPTRDSFYDLPDSQYATLGWRLPLGKLWSVGVQAGYGKGPTIQPFGTFGAVSPALNNGSRQITGLISMRARVVYGRRASPVTLSRWSGFPVSPTRRGRRRMMSWVRPYFLASHSR
jgi:hypothetical protein